MSKIFCAVILFTFLPVLAQERAKPSPYAESDTLLLYAPFDDHSGFNGKWNLAVDVPRFLSAYCRQRFQVGVVGPVAVAYYDTARGISSGERESPTVLREYAEQFRSRYLIFASIETFSITRFIVAEQRLAGYEAFAAEVMLKFSLFDGAHIDHEMGTAPLYQGEAVGVIKDKSLGITLFGKQTDRTNQYFSLDDLYFGGGQFNKTIVGEAMVKCAEDLSSKLEKAIPLLKTKSTVLSSTIRVDTANAESSITLTRRLIRGEVVLVDSDEVFLNIGSEEGILVGDVLPVYSEGAAIRDPKTNEVLGESDARIGEVQIIEVRAAHLSMATILKGKEAIKPRSKVRAIVVR